MTRIPKRKEPAETFGKHDVALPLREIVLETLLQLHLDFGVLGQLNAAGPSLHKLMALAHGVSPDKNSRPARRRRASANGRESKPALQ